MIYCLHYCSSHIGHGRAVFKERECTTPEMDLDIGGYFVWHYEPVRCLDVKSIIWYTATGSIFAQSFLDSKLSNHARLLVNVVLQVVTKDAMFCHLCMTTMHTASDWEVVGKNLGTMLLNDEIYVSIHLLENLWNFEYSSFRDHLKCCSLQTLHQK